MTIKSGPRSLGSVNGDANFFWRVITNQPYSLYTQAINTNQTGGYAFSEIRANYESQFGTEMVNIRLLEAKNEELGIVDNGSKKFVALLQAKSFALIRQILLMGKRHYFRHSQSSKWRLIDHLNQPINGLAWKPNSQQRRQEKSEQHT